MQLDHVDLGAAPTHRGADAAPRFLRPQVRGHVVARQEVGLQLARRRLARVCEAGTVGSGSDRTLVLV